MSSIFCHMHGRQAGHQAHAGGRSCQGSCRGRQAAGRESQEPAEPAESSVLHCAAGLASSLRCMHTADRTLIRMQALAAAQTAAEAAGQQAGEASARAARYKRAFRDIDQMISWARTPSSARRSDTAGSTLWTTG